MAIVSNTGSLLCESAIQRWLRQDTLYKLPFLDNLHFNLTTQEGALFFAVSTASTPAQVGGILLPLCSGRPYFQSRGSETRPLAHERDQCAPNPWLRQQSLLFVSESMCISSPNVFSLQACEGLQLRGSSADQVKRSLFQVHLLTRGRAAAIHSRISGYELHCSTLLNESRRHRARKRDHDKRERMGET